MAFQVLDTGAAGEEQTDTWVNGRADVKSDPVFWTLLSRGGREPLLRCSAPSRSCSFMSGRFPLFLGKGMVALRDEPATMIAYRGREFDTSGALPIRIFGGVGRREIRWAVPSDFLKRC